jgi:branched-chain amino acid transport system permease protein
VGTAACTAADLLASISGALYGALFIQFVPNMADEISKAAPWAIYGVFLIGFMYLMPSGVAGLIKLLGRRFPAKLSVPLPGRDVQV